MKYLMILAVCLSCCNPLNAQKKRSVVPKEIDRIKASLNVYASLSPFSENENIFNEIDSVRNEIVSVLLRLFNNPEVVNFPMAVLLEHDELFIATSPDQRIWFFSLDEKTGGSYRSGETIIHTRYPSGKVSAAIFGGAESEAMATAFYSEPFLIDSLAKNYVVIGSVITCNTCVAKLALLLNLESDTLNTSLITQYDGRSYNLIAFDFFTERKEIALEYLIEENETLEEDKLQLPTDRYRYHEVFRYIADSFKRTESCEFLLNE